MKKSRKALWISLVCVDVGITIFLFVLSIIMLCTIPNVTKRKEIEARGVQNMIEWFQMNPTMYLIIGVIPLFILLVVNIIALYFYVKKLNAKKAVQLNDLSAAEKDALKKELLKDLNSDK